MWGRKRLTPQSCPLLPTLHTAHLFYFFIIMLGEVSDVWGYWQDVRMSQGCGVQRTHVWTWFSPSNLLGIEFSSPGFSAKRCFLVYPSHQSYLSSWLSPVFSYGKWNLIFQNSCCKVALKRGRTASAVCLGV